MAAPLRRADPMTAVRRPSEGDFFRSPRFLRAEGVTHSLVVEGPSAVALPVIVREIPGGGVDAISPYGYPGARTEGPPPEPADDRLERDGPRQPLRARPRRRAARRSPGAPSARRSGSPTRPSPARCRKRLREQIRRNERARVEHRGRARHRAARDAQLAPRSSAPTPRRWRRTGAADRYLLREPLLRGAARAPRAPGCVAGGPGGRAPLGGRRSRSSATGTCTTTWAGPPTRRSETRR